VGYCAVKGSFDLGALILFLMIVLWQMPHFFAIAIYRLEDYAAASIPVLPIKRGMFATKVQMLLYTLAFVAVSCMLTFFGVAGYSYLFVALFLGSVWSYLCFKGFRAANDKLWARQMFSFSLIIVIALCGAIPFCMI
jgi:protoheme IX farnesyltransferase